MVLVWYKFPFWEDFLSWSGRWQALAIPILSLCVPCTVMQVCLWPMMLMHRVSSGRHGTNQFMPTFRFYSVFQKDVRTQRAFRHWGSQRRSFPWGGSKGWGRPIPHVVGGWLTLSLESWSWQYVLRASFSSNNKNMYLLLPSDIYSLVLVTYSWRWVSVERGLR